jgi:hypothetical protein
LTKYELRFKCCISKFIYTLVPSNCFKIGSMIKSYPITLQKPHFINFSRILTTAVTLVFLFSTAAFSTEGENRFTQKDLRLGQRLFKGLVPFESGTFDCSSCHYITVPKEIDWNPSAYDLALAWLEEGGTDIYNIMNSPTSTRLLQEHEGMSITREEELLLKAYLTHVAETGLGELKPYPIRMFSFWILGLLMALAVVDLLFTRKIPYRIIHIVILVVGIGVHGSFAHQEAVRVGRTQGYAPDQPIKFSHQIHAGENEIDCRYCHFTADFSLSGGIPSNNVCLNCHGVIRTGTLSGNFEINKIHRAEKLGQAIRWVRIHKLPDHSFFSHAQHVNVAGLDCSECHGAVEEMHIVRQVEDLSMGWCINCHRETNVPFLENEYYKSFWTLHEQVKAGTVDSVSASRLGGLNCMKCHY